MPAEGLNMRNVMVFEEYVINIDRMAFYNRIFFFGGNEIPSRRM
jgi:hypothetical protein